MFLRVFLFSLIGKRCVILLLKTLRMILHGSSGMRNLRTLFDLASDWLMEKWSVLIGREKISRD